MLAAYSLGMTRGDWTFLDVEIFQVENNHDFLHKPHLNARYINTRVEADTDKTSATHTS
jgi:hypothetical protein